MKSIRLSEELRYFIVNKKQQNVPSKKIQDEIEEKFHRRISYYTIRQTWARYLATGSIEYNKPLGRPRIMTDREERSLVRDFISHPGKSIHSTIELQNQQPIARRPVSRRTVRRVLRRRGLQPRISSRGSEIKLKNRTKRLKFAQEHVNWTSRDWSKIVFSDESTLYPKRTRTRVIWSHANAPRSLPFEDPLADKSINVWGYMRYDGEIRLFRFEGTMKQDKYLRMLQENLSNAVAPPRGSAGKLVFMHDRASYHTASDVKKWLYRNHRNYILWPSQSPDISLIENIWATIKNELWNQRARIKSAEDIWRLSQEIVQNITLVHIHNLYNSLPERMEAIIKNSGNRINY